MIGNLKEFIERIFEEGLKKITIDSIDNLVNETLFDTVLLEIFKR